jgi:hypothetical protein
MTEPIKETDAPPPPPSALSRLVRAWLLTAVSDGLFSSVLAAGFYGSTVARLWQGVAATLLGRAALDGGTRTVAIGIVMHFCVALCWSTVFLFLFTRSRWIRGVVASRYGVLKVAAVYGPSIWLVMSLIVIPLLVHRPTSITYRWWVQLIGHFPFVAIPIVASIGGGFAQSGRQAEQHRGLAD